MMIHSTVVVWVVSAGAGLIHDEAVREPEDQQWLEESNDQEEIVPQLAGSLRHMRLDGQP